jgi:hypothetical protein
MAGDTTKSYVGAVLAASNDPVSPVAEDCVRECGILHGANSLHVTQ